MYNAKEHICQNSELQADMSRTTYLISETKVHLTSSSSLSEELPFPERILSFTYRSRLDDMYSNSIISIGTLNFIGLKVRNKCVDSIGFYINYPTTDDKILEICNDLSS